MGSGLQRVFCSPDNLAEGPLSVALRWAPTAQCVLCRSGDGGVYATGRTPSHILHVASRIVASRVQALRRASSLPPAGCALRRVSEDEHALLFESLVW